MNPPHLDRARTRAQLRHSKKWRKKLKAEKKFMAYLERHEGDITLEIDDFSDLRGIFKVMFGRKPVSMITGVTKQK